MTTTISSLSVRVVTFVAQRDGVLFLGVNEGDLADNTGTFDIVIEAEAGNGARSAR